MAKNKGGRPTVFTKGVLNKLNEAFAWGCTDREACLYAGISERILYEYQKENEGFLRQKVLLKENPVLMARQAVVDNLKDNPDLALKYLERKRKREFSLRTETDLTTKDQPITGFNYVIPIESDS